MRSGYHAGALPLTHRCSSGGHEAIHSRTVSASLTRERTRALTLAEACHDVHQSMSRATTATPSDRSSTSLQSMVLRRSIYHVARARLTPAQPEKHRRAQLRLHVLALPGRPDRRVAHLFALRGGSRGTLPRPSDRCQGAATRGTHARIRSAWQGDARAPRFLTPAQRWPGPGQAPRGPFATP